MKAFGNGLVILFMAAALLLVADIPKWGALSPPASVPAVSGGAKGPAFGPAQLQAAQGQSPERSGSSNFSPAEAQEVHRAMEAARRSLGLQTELPAPATPDQPRRRNIPPYSGSSEPFLNQYVAQVLLWLAIALAVGAILWTMKDMWGRTADLRPEGEVHDGGGSAEAVARMDQAQAGADDLARRGDYIGAMHLLLLQSVGELRRRLNVAIAASLTSREIWARTSLPPEGKKAFGDIIGRVEISWFGPHQPGADDFMACRRSFETLTLVLKQVGGASARPRAELAAARPAGPSPTPEPGAGS